VLMALGYGGTEAGRALRFSCGWESTRLDWDRLLEALRRAFTELAS
jgi:cysteine sulfinate desulfinase/cysteine desulfurase-like protein